VTLEYESAGIRIDGHVQAWGLLKRPPVQYPDKYKMEYGFVTKKVIIVKELLWDTNYQIHKFNTNSEQSEVDTSSLKMYIYIKGWKQNDKMKQGFM